MRLDEYITSHFDELWHFLHRQLYPSFHDDTEDFIQEGLIKALNVSDRYTFLTERRIKKFILVTCRNAAIEFIRKTSNLSLIHI